MIDLWDLAAFVAGWVAMSAALNHDGFRDWCFRVLDRCLGAAADRIFR